MSRWVPALALLFGGAGCVFAPDLSRFPACDGQGGCPGGSTCLAAEGLCLPDCGAHGPCLPDTEEDAGSSDGGTAAGGTADAGVSPLHLAGPGILADFVSGQPYEERLSAVGGRAPYRFELQESSALPSGLLLEASGAVTGSSSSTGSTSFPVKVTDSSRPPQTDTLTLQIKASDCMLGAVCVRTRSAPEGRVGERYGYTLRAVTKGTSPTWKVDSGTLPPGLELLSTGQLSGTPTQAGRYPFSVTVTDILSATATKSLSLEIIF